nr:MAG TPA: hypothetical protein [Caudoviricetes sp.]
MTRKRKMSVSIIALLSELGVVDFVHTDEERFSAILFRMIGNDRPHRTIEKYEAGVEAGCAPYIVEISGEDCCTIKMPRYSFNRTFQVPFVQDTHETSTGILVHDVSANIRVGHTHQRI